MDNLSRQKCTLFTYSLRLLDVDDDGLTDATDFDDVKAIAQVCPEINEITRACANLQAGRGIQISANDHPDALRVSPIFRQPKRK